MLREVFSCAMIGVNGVLVEVEAAVGAGQPGMVLVGLPDAAVQESKERVRAAIRNSGGRFLHGRVTVNLAPADLKKAGPTYDMPIAIGILLASQAVLAPLDDALLVGEMSLDGELRHTPGIISMVSVAADRGIKRAFVPAVDAQEAALGAGITVYPVRNLAELVQHLNGFASIEPVETVRSIANLNGHQRVVDFADIRGQEHVKRGMGIAAAGAHNLIISRLPGTGKTLLARLMPSILPAMSLEEALEVTRIYSVKGLLPIERPLVTSRPFRPPHHKPRGARRRGLVAAARRDQPRAPGRALPRRATRILHVVAGGAAPAAGGQAGDAGAGKRDNRLRGQCVARRKLAGSLVMTGFLDRQNPPSSLGGHVVGVRDRRDGGIG